MSRAADVPLALRMRPRTLDEVVGQPHLVGPDGLLRRMVESRVLRPLVLFGPPGTGKTSVVHVIQGAFGLPLVRLNAVESGVRELREAVALAGHAGRVLLHVDEVHRFARNQVETLLPALEDGRVVLVGTTSENPFLTLPPALRSRLLVLEFQPLSPQDVAAVLRRALSDEERGLARYRPRLAPGLLEELAESVGGDLRVAMNALELAVRTAPEEGGPGERVVRRDSLFRFLRRELHTFSTSDAYDLLSALQKSVRGSDPHAALFYLARLVSVEVDVETIARRVVVMAAEDVGTAEPGALAVAVAAAEAARMVGYPEARIPLAQAVAYLAVCPKSNAAYAGLARALEDVQAGRGRVVPSHLREASYRGAAALGRGTGYRYPHDDPRHWVPQPYLPDDLSGRRYYEPSGEGRERAIRERLRELEEWARKARTAGPPEPEGR